MEPSPFLGRILSYIIFTILLVIFEYLGIYIEFWHTT